MIERRTIIDILTNLARTARVSLILCEWISHINGNILPIISVYCLTTVLERGTKRREEVPIAKVTSRLTTSYLIRREGLWAPQQNASQERKQKGKKSKKIAKTKVVKILLEEIAGNQTSEENLMKKKLEPGLVSCLRSKRWSGEITEEHILPSTTPLLEA